MPRGVKLIGSVGLSPPAGGAFEMFHFFKTVRLSDWMCCPSSRLLRKIVFGLMYLEDNFILLLLCYKPDNQPIGGVREGSHN